MRCERVASRFSVQVCNCPPKSYGVKAFGFLIITCFKPRRDDELTFDLVMDAERDRTAEDDLSMGWQPVRDQYDCSLNVVFLQEGCILSLRLGMYIFVHQNHAEVTEF